MDINPYASPGEFSKDVAAPPIDKAARDEIGRAVDDFLSDRIGAFAFDERLWEVHGLTNDRTAKIIVEQLWYVYDDREDHQAVLDKREWDEIQRLMLVLKSDAELQRTCRRASHPSQAVAVATLFLTGLGCVLLWDAWPLYFLAAGLVSIALARWRGSELQAIDEPDPWNMRPFTSFAAIGHALARAPGFRKQKYRPDVGRRTIRPPSSEFVTRLQCWTAWCFASPPVLLVQCFPLEIDRLVLVESA